MRSLVSKSLRATLLTLTLVLVVAAASPITSLSAQAPGEISIVCENETAPGIYNNAVSLVTQDGYIGIPDGNTVYMWGYALDVDIDLVAPGVQYGFQHPGPTLCFTEGQAVTITLTNLGFSQLPSLTDAVSIIFPGQTGVTHDDGTPGLFTGEADSGGGTVTYSFTASLPGTFIYGSGTDPQKQVQMGLFGAIIVRPTLGPNFLYNWTSTQFNPANDYMMLLSEIDPDLHWAVEQGLPYDITLFHPRYWLINGRSFPDTIAPNDAEWLPTQPYGALLHIEPFDAASSAFNYSAVRFLNVGMRNHPMHPHGDHIQVVGRDGRPLQGPLGEDLSYAEFGPVIGAGQTKDTLYNWEEIQLGPSGSLGLPTDIFEALNQFLLRPRDQNIMWGEWFSGSPYLGQTTDRPTGVTAQGECGEYYQIWHSHALHEAANYESGFGGMITLERIDPPGGCPP